MATQGMEHFPELKEWSAEELRQLRYRRFSISIFDHWLTPDEWLENLFVSLERARIHGVERIYHEQNRRYREFYRVVFEGGVYRVTGSKLKPQVVWHQRWDRRLKKAVTAMVEDRTWGTNIYAPAHQVRVMSGDVRTATILLEASASFEALASLAECHGLCLID